MFEVFSGTDRVGSIGVSVAASGVAPFGEPFWRVGRTVGKQCAAVFVSGMHPPSVPIGRDERRRCSMERSARARERTLSGGSHRSAVTRRERRRHTPDLSGGISHYVGVGWHGYITGRKPACMLAGNSPDETGHDSASTADYVQPVARPVDVTSSY
ncbi:hypothetical protein AArcMg_0571 [Natrarchaeobaculum sulfurireducens]|uniref:Uncharacterized protein n=1 Tax=Natrarchaeobaculum sulfurireducens TaxID=2044521 RepID=A0A346PM49_9EURY|nr:hypothetical protein AArcMg_0571 [Natrarchaeobaculum sulfurireducens]